MQTPQNTDGEPRCADNAAKFADECARLYYGALVRYAYGICRNRAMALDAVQDTFAKLIRLNACASMEHAQAWLYKSCRNRVIDILRKGGSVKVGSIPEGVEFSDGNPLPNQHAVRNETFRQIEKAKAELNERQREIVALKFDFDMSYKQIAEITEMSPNAVGVALHEAIKKLRLILKKEESLYENE